MFDSCFMFLSEMTNVKEHRKEQALGFRNYNRKVKSAFSQSAAWL